MSRTLAAETALSQYKSGAQAEAEQGLGQEENFCTATEGKSAAVALVLYLVLTVGSEGKKTVTSAHKQ